MSDLNDYERKEQIFKMIVATLRELDKYNLEHSDAKMLVKDLFIDEIMKTQEISKYLAVKWLEEALKYNKQNHELSLQQEAKKRNDTNNNQAE